MAWRAKGGRSDRLRKLHLYRLQFHADDDGLGKVVEFYAPDSAYAVEFIESDDFKRDVNVLEDGRLILQVSHGPGNLQIRYIG